MRHRKANNKLGRTTSHKWALFRNLLTALFSHERIVTTETKAKALQPLAERMVTLAKREDLHARRQVLRLVPDPVVVKKLFGAVAARYADRRGGYTRVIKVGSRSGDGAPTAVLELVDRPEAEKDKGKKEGKKGKGAKPRREGKAEKAGERKKAEAAAGD